MNKNLFFTNYSSEESFINIYNALNSKLDIDWIVLEEGPKYFDKKNIINNYEDYLLNNHFDKIFVTSGCLKIYYWNLKKLKTNCNQMILITFDDEYKFNKNFFEAQFYNTILCTDLISSHRYKYYGLNAFYTGHPVNIKKNLDYKHNLKDEIVFIGNVNDTSDRIEKIDLLKKKYRNFISIDNRGYVNLRLKKVDLEKYYKESSIILNFSKLDNGRLQRLNLCNDYFIKNLYGFKGRPLEVFAAGGFCLSEWSRTLEYIFRDLSEVILFKNNDEMFERIDYFLSNKDKISKIKKEAIKILDQNYSYSSWNKRIFEILNLFEKNNNTAFNNNYIFPKKILKNHFLDILKFKVSNENTYINKINCLLKNLFIILNKEKKVSFIISVLTSFILRKF